MNANKTRLIRRPEVEARTGYKRASIYKLVAAGKFPQPLALGDRAVAWIEEEVEEWIAARVAARETVDRSARNPRRRVTEAAAATR